MYLDFLVQVPSVKGKIIVRNLKGTDYVYYEYDREYDPSTQKTNPKRVTIGKRSKADLAMMQPNDKFLQYFPETELPEDKNRSSRSSCLRIGSYIVIRKIIEEYGLREMLEHYMSPKDAGLFLDLAAYAIVTENNAGQYYPDYAYNHPLFTQNMRVYSDSKVSDFLGTMTDDRSIEFMNEWNGNRDHREKIYISYDSTNKNSQAGNVSLMEYGHPKVDVGLPIFNYAVAYDTDNKEPLFYEKYPGSINDVSQLEYMVDRAYGYGYRHIGFILDRGYFSKPNIESMDAKGYSFVIMVKGKADLVKELVSGCMGTFEKKRKNYIDAYDTYGITIKRRLYATDKEERYFHIYHSVQKESAERTALEKRIRQMKTMMDKHVGERKSFGSGIEKYFILHYNDKTGQFQFYEEKIGVIEEELSYCGYYAIITSEQMRASEALNLYKSRDASEKLFRGDKSYLGDKSMRTYGGESTDSKIFVEFVALIIRNRIYNRLKDKMKTMDRRPNYMTVPAALRELEKIEMVRLTDTKYHLDHAVTATQKDILDAFGLDSQNVKYRAEEISRKLCG
jgi:hypothetical protein